MTAEGSGTPKKSIRKRLAAFWHKTWKLLWHRPHRRATAILIPNLIVLSTVLLGMVLEQAFPINEAARSPGGWRVFSAVVSLAALTATVYWRGHWDRKHGTLYHVTLLASLMRDLHTTAGRLAKEHHLAVRTSSRQLSLQSGTIVVATDEVAEVTSELSLLYNLDTRSTGDTVAPNMLFPVALATGYEWRGMGQTKVVELDDRAEGKDGMGTQLTLEDVTAQVAELCAMNVRNPLSRVDVRAPTEAPVKVVWLYIAASEKAAVRARDLRVLSLPKGSLVEAADLRRNIGVLLGGDLARLDFKPNGVVAYRNALGVSTNLTAGAVAAAIADSIHKTCLEFPKATVIVSSMTLKSVNFAAGYGLREAAEWTEATDSREPAHDVWGRLVPLHYMHPPTNVVPMIVHPNQRRLTPTGLAS